MELSTNFNLRVYGLLINELNQVLISDENRNGFAFTKFPGGGMEFGEGFKETLIREFQEELNARKNEEFQLVLERANRVIKQVAEAEKYDLVLQEAVYINPKHDITDKVLKVINAAK